MNERIKALSEEADKLASRSFAPHTLSWSLDYNTKFAELIIRECARISNAVDDTWTGQGLASAQAFMRHFGVEE